MKYLCMITVCEHWIFILVLGLSLELDFRDGVEWRNLGDFRVPIIGNPLTYFIVSLHSRYMFSLRFQVTTMVFPMPCPWSISLKSHVANDVTNISSLIYSYPHTPSLGVLFPLALSIQLNVTRFSHSTIFHNVYSWNKSSKTMGN